MSAPSRTDWPECGVWAQVRILAWRALRREMADWKLVFFGLLQPVVLLVLFSQVFRAVGALPGMSGYHGYAGYLGSYSIPCIREIMHATGAPAVSMMKHQARTAPDTYCNNAWRDLPRRRLCEPQPPGALHAPKDYESVS